MGYIQDAVNNARKLGSPCVSVCPGMTPVGEDLSQGWAQLRKSFEELLDYAESKDITLLVEPAHRYESTLILTVEDGLRMIDEIGYEGFMSAELGFQYTGEPDPAVEQTLAALSRMFGQ